MFGADFDAIEQELFLMRPWEEKNRLYYRWKNGLETYPAETEQMIRQEIAPFWEKIWEKNPLAGDIRILTAQHFLRDHSIRLNKHIRYMAPNFHQHDFFEIPFVYSGRCVQTCEGVEYEMEAGDLCIMPPFAKHRISVMRDDTIVLNILFRKNVFDSFLCTLLSEENLLSSFFCHAVYQESFDHQILIKTGDDPTIRRLVLLMFAECQKPGKLTDSFLMSLLNTFFIHLIRDHLTHIVTLSGGVPEQNNIMDVLLYLQTNFKDVTLKSAAQKFSYSENYISRLIKKYTGKSFSKNLQEIRLNHAIRLLNDTSQPLDKIAAESGFFDLSHFYRCFKQEYRVTPVQYRKRRQQGEELGHPASSKD